MAAESPPRFWSALSTADFAALDLQRTIAVLPLGATEQHGPHLPLDVDRMIVDGLVLQSLPLLPDSLPVLYLPTMAIGPSLEHADFPGTLSLSAETTLRLWRDIGASVARTGIRKLVFLNGHGGNVSSMDLVGRELRAHHGLMVFSVNWFDLGVREVCGETADLSGSDASGSDASGSDAFGIEVSKIDEDELRFGIHAGALETSVIAALSPGAVRWDSAGDFPSLRKEHRARHPLFGSGAARLSWLAQDLNPAGAVGNAGLATEALGRRIIAAVCHRWVTLLAEIDRITLDELSSGPLSGGAGRKRPS